MRTLTLPRLSMALLSIALLAMTSSVVVAQPGGERDRPRGGFNLDTIVDRIMNFDSNKDGKLSKDEMPERMQERFGDADTNSDGSIDRAELKQLAEKMMARFGGGNRDGDRPRRPGGPEGDRPRPDGDRPGPGGPEGHRGPPSAEQLVDHAMEFDVDKDGKLDKEELLEFAKVLIERRGRGPGPGGPPPRGEGRDRPGPPERGPNDRPKRPSLDEAF